MHVLVVTQYFWPESFRINDIVTGLQERGHRVTVLTGHPNYPSGQFTHGYTGRAVQEEQYGTVRVLRVPMLPRGQKSGLKLGLNYLSFALMGSLLGPWLATERYDVIFVYEPSPMTVGFPAMAIRAKTGRPIVFYVQDLWPESLAATGFVTHPLLLKATEYMVRWIYCSCTMILVTSRAFIGRVERLGVKRDSIRYYPQYAETFYQPLLPDEQWARQQGLPTGFTIMFAGNMGMAQDLFTVLSAAQLTASAEIHWVFVGDGSARAELETQVATLGLHNVHFLGSHPATAMPQWFAQADVLLVSLSADELFALTVPAKVQSYLACGRPILASLDGEGATIVREAEAGHVVAPQNARALADAALALQGIPPEERAAMGQRGRAYHERHFEREQRLSELEELFGQVGAEQ
jgi:colanic acid biosynthesis glycosyl transferase WcaI